MIKSLLEEQAEDIALELLTKMKGWNIAAMDPRYQGLEASLAAMAHRANATKVFEWALLQKETKIEDGEFSLLAYTLYWPLSVPHFELVMKHRVKEVTEKARRAAARNVYDNRYSAKIDPLPIVARLLEPVKDWSQLSYWMLGTALLRENDDFARLLMAKDKASRYSDIYVERWPMLHWILIKQRLHMFDAIVATGYDMNTQASDDNYATPLITAAKNGWVDIVKRLLAIKTVNVNTQDRGRMTALDWAATNGHKEIVELLKARRAFSAMGFGAE
jgi:hypothetical protein